MRGEEHHTSRDRHLFGAGPKRILALDGGGVRGVISVAFVRRIEAILAAQAKTQIRLCDAFDLIGGTSTGSIVGTALAIGRTTDELERIYHELAPRVFAHAFRIPFLQAKFDADKLRREIAAIVGDMTLDTDKLETGLAIVAKRTDSGSVWLVSNSPRAPYWENRPEHDYIGNQKYKLANLIRASTAAPTFFEPELIPILEGMRPGLFIDGGVSPHNNPALALFMLSQLKPYGLCWPTGIDQLTIVSIGTGSHRNTLDPASLGRMQNVTIALHALTSLIDDSQGLGLALMQWIGKCLTPWIINSEWGALAHDQLGIAPQFRFLRYDVRLEKDWLTEHVGMTLTDEQLAGVRQMDNPRFIPLAYEIGCAAAERQVLAQHWGAGPDTPSDPL